MLIAVTSVSSEPIPHPTTLPSESTSVTVIVNENPPITRRTVSSAVYPEPPSSIV